MNKKVQQIAKNNIKILNFCDDYIISNSFFEKKTLLYLKDFQKTLEYWSKKFNITFYGKSFMIDKKLFKF